MHLQVPCKGIPVEKGRAGKGARYVGGTEKVTHWGLAEGPTWEGQGTCLKHTQDQECPMGSGCSGRS